MRLVARLEGIRLTINLFMRCPMGSFKSIRKVKNIADDRQATGAWGKPFALVREVMAKQYANGDKDRQKTQRKVRGLR